MQNNYLSKNIKYDDLYSNNKDNISEFNKSLYFHLLNNAEKNNQNLIEVTEKIIDEIWEQQYSKFNNQQKSTKFLRKFDKYKNSKTYKIILHLHRVIGIKNIDLIGKEVSYSDFKYIDYLNNTHTYLQNLKDLNILDNIMESSHFNTLLAKNTFVKYINKLKANRIYRNSALEPKNGKLKTTSTSETNLKRDNREYISALMRECFFPIIEIYLTKIKIKKIHSDIKPLLKALAEFKHKHKKTSYSFGLTDDRLNNHFEFVNIFPERDTNLYLILIFSIYLKVPYEDSRNLLALLLGYELKGGFGKRTDLEKRFKDLENLELMIEYIDNQ